MKDAQEMRLPNTALGIQDWPWSKKHPGLHSAQTPARSAHHPKIPTLHLTLRYGPAWSEAACAEFLSASPDELVRVLDHMVRKQRFIKSGGNAEDADLDAIRQKVFSEVQNGDCHGGNNQACFGFY